MINAAMIYKLTLYMCRAFTCLYLLREIRVRIASIIYHLTLYNMYVFITRHSDA